MICDRIDRRMAYASGALLSGVATIPMLLGPYSALTFAVGLSLYALAAGYCFAAFSALSFELIGNIGQSVSTRYTLFVAAGNLPLAYMIWIDGQGDKRFGPRGLFGVDAVVSVVTAVVFISLFRTAWRRPKVPPSHVHTFES